MYYLGSEVLKHGGQVNRSAGPNALRIPSLLQVTADSSDGELQTGLHGPRDRLLLRATSLPSSGSFLHFSTGVHGRARERKIWEFELFLIPFDLREREREKCTTQRETRIFWEYGLFGVALKHRFIEGGFVRCKVYLVSRGCEMGLKKSRALFDRWIRLLSTAVERYLVIRVMGSWPIGKRDSFYRRVVFNFPLQLLALVEFGICNFKK